MEAIRQGLKDGTIDVITSGHRPVHQEEKERDIVNAGWGDFCAGEQLFLCQLLIWLKRVF